MGCQCYEMDAKRKIPIKQIKNENTDNSISLDITSDEEKSNKKRKNGNGTSI